MLREFTAVAIELQYDISRILFWSGIMFWSEAKARQRQGKGKARARQRHGNGKANAMQMQGE